MGLQVECLSDMQDMALSRMLCVEDARGSCLRFLNMASCCPFLAYCALAVLNKNLKTQLVLLRSRRAFVKLA